MWRLHGDIYLTLDIGWSSKQITHLFSRYLRKASLVRQSLPAWTISSNVVRGLTSSATMYSATMRARSKSGICFSARMAMARRYKAKRSKDHNLHAPSQSKTTLHCNVVSHWLGAYVKWSLQKDQPLICSFFNILFKFITKPSKPHITGVCTVKPFNQQIIGTECRNRCNGRH